MYSQKAHTKGATIPSSRTQGKVPAGMLRTDAFDGLPGSAWAKISPEEIETVTSVAHNILKMEEGGRIKSTAISMLSIFGFDMRRKQFDRLEGLFERSPDAALYCIKDEYIRSIRSTGGMSIAHLAVHYNPYAAEYALKRKAIREMATNNNYTVAHECMASHAPILWRYAYDFPSIGGLSTFRKGMTVIHMAVQESAAAARNVDMEKLYFIKTKDGKTLKDAAAHWTSPEKDGKPAVTDRIWNRFGIFLTHMPAR